ncbi:MAG TPA: capsule assembly Wzi family protein [Gemmatimonadales bacterium]
MKRSTHHALAVVLSLLAFTSRPAAAQQLVIPGSELDGYLRFLDLRGQAGITPLIFRSASTFRSLGFARSDSARPWDAQHVLADTASGAFRVLVPDLHLVYNSDNPHGANDGALWAGKGISGAVTGGVEVRMGPVVATVAPTLWWTQNQDFPLVPVTIAHRSQFAYPYRVGNMQIDWPQRFGPDAFAALDPGQSGIRANFGWFTTGISSENMWWGPAAVNPIIMSSTAAGVPHLDLGTGRPVDIGIGHLDARMIYGRLAGSAYFDSAGQGGQTRFLVGLALGYSPSFLPGLTVGTTRVFYKHWADTVRLTDIFAPLNSVFKLSFGSLTDPTTNDDRDQILSLVARWALPESGAEFYVEWARNDYNLNLRDFLLEPDHSRGYTYGFAKRVGDGGRFRLRGEVTQLGRSATVQVRATPPFYMHGIVHEGYTQIGQLVGAAIGPGGESEYFGVDRFGPAGRTGFFIQRVVHNSDVYYEQFAAAERRAGHDIEVTAGISAFRFFPAFSAGGQLGVGRELNRNYIVNNDVTNLNLQITLTPR